MPCRSCTPSVASSPGPRGCQYTGCRSTGRVCCTAREQQPTEWGFVMSCQRARDSLVAGVLLLPHATLQTWRADHSSCQPRMHALCVLLLLLCVVVCSRESLVAITCQQTPGPARALARTTPAASPAAKFRRKSSETPPSSPRLPHPARLEPTDLFASLIVLTRSKDRIPDAFFFLSVSK